MTADPVAEIRDLHVTYPRSPRPALGGIDLDIEEGERILVLGPNGSGKSTLLHSLCGLIPGSVDADVEGSVLVGGQAALETPVPALASVVGLLGQDLPSQVCLPRVADELALVLENRAAPPRTIGPRVTDALRRVGVGHLAARRTASLSGGELQCVALAATLLAAPRLVLLDEPTALLDLGGVRRIDAQLRSLHAGDRRPATVMVEHRLQELTSLPPRTVVLEPGGRVAVDGPSAEVFTTHGRWLSDTGSWLPLVAELSLALHDETPLAIPGGGSLPGPSEVLRHRGIERGLRRLAAGSSARSRERPHPRGGGDVVVDARGAAFAVDDHVLVRDVTLRLRAGSITAVIGANGSGKTSLLLGLAGLLPTSAGALRAEPAGMVFQHPQDQFLGRTVEADIAHGLRVQTRRGRPPVDTRRVEAALQRFDLAPQRDADPFRLSGGQQRRLSVAAMAVLEQPVLLLDEPTFGQDRLHATAMADTLRSLAADGAAVVVATHDLRWAAGLADEVVVVADGTVLTVGAPQRVLADGALLDAARLPRPALLDWWADHADIELHRLLDGLDAAGCAATSLTAG